jgi:hypothetical protein
LEVEGEFDPEVNDMLGRGDLKPWFGSVGSARVLDVDRGDAVPYDCETFDEEGCCCCCWNLSNDLIELMEDPVLLLSKYDPESTLGVGGGFEPPVVCVPTAPF